MRAARAAKEFQEAQGDLAAHLEDVVSLDANSSSLDYILQSLLPLLKIVFSELCTNKPDNPSAFLAIWLLEQCAAPASVLADLRQWIRRDENISNPLNLVNGSTKAATRAVVLGKASVLSADIPASELMALEAGGMVVKPPDVEPPESENPRKVAIRSSTKESNASTLKSAFKRKKTTEVDESSEGGNAAKAEPVSPTTPKRRASFWSEKMEEVHHWDKDEEAGADSSDEDVVEGNESVSAEAALQLLRGMKQEQTGGTRSSAHFTERHRRRFTVALTSLDLPLPPKEEVIELLRNVPQFKEFPDADIVTLSRAVRCRKFEPDEAITDFGGPCEDMHIIFEGQGKVSVPQQIGIVKRGDVFGEQALRPSGALNLEQVKAQGGTVTTLSISATDYKELPMSRKVGMIERCDAKTDRIARNVFGDQDIEDKPKRLDGSCEASGLSIVEGYVQTSEDKELIVSALKGNKVLGEVLNLSDDQLALLADAMHLVSLPSHEVLMNKGDRGTALFIVQEGLLTVTQDSSHHGEYKIRLGDSFGELSLLYDAPRPATMAAARDCKLFVLPRYEFRIVIRMSYQERLAQYAHVILKVPCLSEIVDAANVDLIAGALEEISFLEDEEVCIEDEDAGLLFIVWEGECQVLRKGEVVRTLQPGEWVGEEQLMKGIKAAETVKVVSEAAVVLALDSNSLQTVVKALVELKKGQDLESPKSSTMWHPRQSGMLHPRSSIMARMVESTEYIDHADKQKAADDYLQRRMSRLGRARMQRQATGNLETPGPGARPLSQFEQVGLLGEGSFGTVYLLKDAETESLYALKGLLKSHIRKESMESCVKNERSTMLLFESTFIVRLFKTYQDGQHIYFLLEAALGGELFDIYTENDLFGKIDVARFYVACVTMGLSHMHLKRVIYRDLKLENCLLDTKGICKLTDMGIAKVVIGKTYTVCGTADYFAPETLKQVGHNRAVDWWALGVMLFIMLAGRSPFDAPEVSLIYKNIIKGFSKVEFPKTFPSDVTDVIKSLCRKKPEERVTMQKGGVDNFKEMPFFSSLSWENITDQTVVPPFKPKPFDLEALKRKKAERAFDWDVSNVKEWDGGIGATNGLQRTASDLGNSP
jgi:serine/threonine protein kinase/CRP-like cAMP-binding protein